MKTVVIIGAGPSGLITAIKLKQNKTFKRVVVIEKRSTYTRVNLVNLVPDTQSLLPKKVLDELSKTNSCGVPSVSTVPFSTICYKPTKGKPIVVPLNHLEKTLYQYAKAIGVEVVRPTGTQKLSCKFSNGKVIATNGSKVKIIDYDLLIGADGAASSVRKRLRIPKHPFANSKMMKVALVYFDKQMPRRKSVPSGVAGDTQPIIRYLPNTKVPYMGLVVSDKERLALKRYIAGRGTIPKHLASRINSWSVIHGMIKPGQTILPQVSSISYLNIKTWMTKKMHGTLDKKPTVLIGDAVYGPYFFGSSGINASIKAIQCLVDQLKRKSQPLRKSFAIYQKFALNAYKLAHRPKLFVSVGEVEKKCNKWTLSALRKQVKVHFGLSDEKTQQLQKIDACLMLGKDRL